MHIQLWPPGIFNLCQPAELGQRSDFLIRALRFINDHDSACHLKSLQLELCVGAQTIQDIHYNEAALGRLFKALWANRAGVQGFNGQMLLGREDFWDPEQLSPTRELAPGQETGVLLLPVQSLHPQPVERVQLRLEYEQQRKGIQVTYAAELEIALEQYRLKQDYHFPLRGAWMVVNSPLTLNPHRLGYAQEFALDIIRLNSQQRFVRGAQQVNADYPGYGAEVFSAAPGRVIQITDGIPENPGPLGQVLDASQQQRLLQDYKPAELAGGNVVVIEHAQGEYGYYAHLIPGSISVSEGQSVRRGEGLGRLGNSGNSDAPHLHFHLMDGPDLLSARGLPCVFDNLVDVMGQKITTVPENHQLVHSFELTKS